MSERRIGDALRDHDDVVLSTKVGRLLRPGLPAEPASMGWPAPLPFSSGLRLQHDGVMRSYEGSLQRLGLDRIDIHDIGPFNSSTLVGGKTWNYAEAPSDIVERVTGIKRVCAAHAVPLPAAALQFPLAHPDVSSVIPGTSTEHEQRELLSWWKTEIPSELWDDLRSESLLDEAAPTPS